MKVLTKDQILVVNDYETKKVEIPEWKGSVIVRVMSGKARDRFESECRNRTSGGTGRRRNLEGMKALVLSLTVVDDKGQLLFSEEDIPALNEKNGNAIDRLFQVASELNGLGPKQMEAIQGN